MSRFPLSVTHSRGLLVVGAVSLGMLAVRSLAMAWNLLRNRRDDSCSDARLMSNSERESMERATAEIDAEAKGLVRERGAAFQYQPKQKALAV